MSLSLHDFINKYWNAMIHLLNTQPESVKKLNACQGSVKVEFLAITCGNTNCFNTLKKQHSYKYDLKKISCTMCSSNSTSKILFLRNNSKYI